MQNLLGELFHSKHYLFIYKFGFISFKKRINSFLEMNIYQINPSFFLNLTRQGSLKFYNKAKNLVK